MNKSVISLVIILITFVGFNSIVDTYQTKTIENARSLIHKQDSIIQKQQAEMDSIRIQFVRLLESLEFISKVDVTMYNAVEGQTDNTPFITASGAKINPYKATEHRWIAISRDLQSRWGGPLNFGDVVYIKGTGKYDGLYKVNDNMNARYTNRIDILRTEGDAQFAFIGKNIELYRVQKHKQHQFVDSENKWNELHTYMETL